MRGSAQSAGLTAAGSRHASAGKSLARSVSISRRASADRCSRSSDIARFSRAKRLRIETRKSRAIDVVVLPLPDRPDRERPPPEEQGGRERVCRHRLRGGPAMRRRCEPDGHGFEHPGDRATAPTPATPARYGQTSIDQIGTTLLTANSVSKIQARNQAASGATRNSRTKRRRPLRASRRLSADPVAEGDERAQAQRVIQRAVGMKSARV